MSDDIDKLDGPAKPHKAKPELEHVYIRSWPKAVLLYPLLLASILFGLLSLGSSYEETKGTMALVFLIILLINLFLMTFDFNSTASIAIFAIVVAFIFAALFISAKTDISIFAWMRTAMTSLHAWANASFYFGVAAVLGLLFLAMFIHTRLFYWEVTRNEILHHHGLFAGVKRYPAPNVSLSKQYNDIFEYGLLLSGSITIFLTSEKKAVVLDTIPLLKRVYAKIDILLSEIAVDINID